MHSEALKGVAYKPYAYAFAYAYVQPNDVHDGCRPGRKATQTTQLQELAPTCGFHGAKGAAYKPYAYAFAYAYVQPTDFHHGPAPTPLGHSQAS